MPTQPTENEKSIFTYDNFRTYLSEKYAELKARDKKISFRYLARLAGFKSPSFLKLVMDGKSNLSLESIQKISLALKHNKAEANFFENLVGLNQAKTPDEKKKFAEAILKSRAYRKVHPLSEPLHRFISKWYYVVIKEMVDLPHFKEDPEWITKELGAPVTPHEARTALQEMLELGILGRTAQGQLYQIKSFIMTADEVVFSAAADYHKEMIRKAAVAIDRVSRHEREISALTLSVSNETATKIKSLIQAFRKNIMDLCTEDKNPESVFQVNLHLFPLMGSCGQKDEGKKS